MGLNKNSKKSDAIGNLYRAAFFLARGKGEEKLAIALIKKTAKKLPFLAKRLKNILKKYSASRLVLAEKVLDEYLLLK